jgi:hypothetical protein
MNIFAIEKNSSNNSIDWIKSAQSQDNYRVVKMILESCQILSTVLNEQGLKAPYRSFNPKHPSCLWAAESATNFCNLVKHCEAMIVEYRDRFNKTHKCQKVLAQIKILYDQELFPKLASTPLKMAMPSEFKSADVVESYRRFYASKPRVRYPKDKIPRWFRKYRGDQEYQIV